MIQKFCESTATLRRMLQSAVLWVVGWLISSASHICTCSSRLSKTATKRRDMNACLCSQAKLIRSRSKCEVLLTLDSKSIDPRLIGGLVLRHDRPELMGPAWNSYETWTTPEVYSSVAAQIELEEHQIVTYQLTNMFAKTITSISALLALTSAQSAPGFPIQASQPLAIAYGNNTVSPPGEMIPRGGMYPVNRFDSALHSSRAHTNIHNRNGATTDPRSTANVHSRRPPHGRPRRASQRNPRPTSPLDGNQHHAQPRQLFPQRPSRARSILATIASRRRRASQLLFHPLCSTSQLLHSSGVCKSHAEQGRLQCEQVCERCWIDAATCCELHPCAELVG